MSYEDSIAIIDRISERKAKSVGKKTTGLDVVSRHKQMGDLGKLPPDTLSRVAELSTGLPGTLKQQRKTIRESVGKGRQRKSKKTRKSIKRKSRGGVQTRDQARSATAATEAARVRSEAARAEAARIIANPPPRLGLGPQNAAPPAAVARGGGKRRY